MVHTTEDKEQRMVLSEYWDGRLFPWRFKTKQKSNKVSEEIIQWLADNYSNDPRPKVYATGIIAVHIGYEDAALAFKMRWC